MAQHIQYIDGVPLPVRSGPMNGTNAFDPEGELLIYQAVTQHKMRKVRIAGFVNVSVQALNSIVSRVSARIGASNAETLQ